MEKKDEVAGLNLYQRLAKVRDIADVVQKNKSGYGYKYTSEDEILAKVKAGMSKYRVSVYPRVDTDSFENEPREYEKSKYDKSAGKMITTKEVEWVVRGVVIYKILNDDNPEEFFEVAWPMCGSQSDMSQAFGSALTYANRYFYLKFFNIATSEDDPDEWKRKKMEAAEAEDRAAADAMIQRIDDLCRDKVNDANKTDVANLIKRFATDGGKPTANYKRIKKLDEATKLYTALTQYFDESDKGEK
jgi:hypothetical protein